MNPNHYPMNHILMEDYYPILAGKF
jgi:hypothetical protein